MAIPTWPSFIPLKIRYGTEMELGAKSKVMTEMEFGPTIARNRFIRSNVPHVMNIEAHFTDEQYRRFLQFWGPGLYNGVRSFFAPVLTDNAIVIRQCKITNDSIKPNFSTYNRVIIPLSFEIRGGFTISDQTYYFVDLWGEDYTLAFSDTFGPIINDMWPAASFPYYW